LLRSALERETRYPARSHRFTRRAGGKLECAAGPAVSLGHSGHWVACALATGGDVGLDVELPSPRRHAIEIAESYFSSTEREWLRAEPSEAFYFLWVLKEAYLKCLGRALWDGLGLLECRVAPPTIAARAAMPAHLALFSLDDAFVGVATTADAAPEIRIERWGRHAQAAPIRLVATTEGARDG
jgi:phosphopantetheinyl transferase